MMPGKQTKAVFLAVAAVFVTAGPLLAAQVSMPVTQARAGETVESSVQYRAQGAEVAALNFDLAFDDSVLTITPTVGSAAADAGKGLEYTVLPSGNLRVLIFGVNENVIGDGSLIDLTIEVSADSSPGPHVIEFVDATFASPDAEAVPVRVRSGRVIRVGGP